MYSLLSGYQLGSQIAKDYDAATTRQGLADAQNDIRVQEQGSGAEAEKNFRDNFVPQEGGPQSADEAIQQQGLQSVFDTQKASVTAGGKQFDSRDSAEAALPGLKDAAAAGYLRGRGKVEEANQIEAGARKRQADELALKGATRADQLQETVQPLKLAQVKYEIEQWPQELEKKVIAGQLDMDAARRQVVGRFVDSIESVPQVAQGWLQSGFLGKAFPDLFKGATDLSRDGSNLVITYEDGKKVSAPAASLRRFAEGAQPPKFTTVAEGAALVSTDRHGNAKEVYRAPKTPDPTKNDAQMDDARSVMTRFLDTNKTMMTQFGGREQDIRQNATLMHDQALGEFKTKFGRAPTLEEAAKIARQAFDVASKQAQ